VESVAGCGLCQASSPLPFLLLRIGVHQRADHALIGHAALLGGALEKCHRALRQAQRHLYIFLAQHKLVRRRQEILDDPDAADFALAVLDRWLFHGRRSFNRSPKRAGEDSLPVMPALVAGIHVLP